MLTRTKFVECDDGWFECTLRVTIDDIQKVINFLTISSASEPLVTHDASVTHNPPAQVVGVAGVSLTEFSYGGDSRKLSLSALARHAPFQAFIESIFGQTDDSYQHAVHVLQSSSVPEVERLLDDYSKWSASKSHQSEPPFPDYLFV